MQDRTGSRWAFVPGQELPRDNPHSPGHQRSDLQHTRVDSSQKTPQFPKLALILDKGRGKHLQEHIAPWAGQKGSALGLL